MILGIDLEGAPCIFAGYDQGSHGALLVLSQQSQEAIHADPQRPRLRDSSAATGSGLLLLDAAGS